MRASDKRCLLVEVSGFDNSSLPAFDMSLFAQWIIYLLRRVVLSPSLILNLRSSCL